MAKVSPYADPSAHGKITPGLCFKRRGPIVQLGKCPRPKDKKSAAQINQRNKITEAVAKYKILNNDELIFLRRRGSMISKNPYMLYTSSQLKGNDWSKQHGHQLQVINNMVIFDLIQDQLEEIRFTLLSSNTKDITDNIVLYSKLDSETAGIIPSVNGPSFTWEGIIDHAPLKFEDGAFGFLNTTLIRADDDGDFYEECFDQHQFSAWLELTYDLIDGKPQDGNNHVIFDWKGANTAGGSNLIQIILDKNQGVVFVILVNGVRKDFKSADSNIAFTAGEKIYFSFAYNINDIDTGISNWEMYFGTNEDLYLVGAQTSIFPPMDTTSTYLTMLSNNSKTASLNGGLDNIKVVNIATRSSIDEMNNTRNIEEFETELGYVFDNENIFFPGVEVSEVLELILKVENFSALPWRLPFYWLLAVTWSNQTTDQRTTNIRFPKIELEFDTAVRFYLSSDMSLYFDQNLIRLGATSNV